MHSRHIIPEFRRCTLFFRLQSFECSDDLATALSLKICECQVKGRGSLYCLGIVAALCDSKFVLCACLVCYGARRLTCLCLDALVCCLLFAFPCRVIFSRRAVPMDLCSIVAAGEAQVSTFLELMVKPFKKYLGKKHPHLLEDHVLCFCLQYILLRAHDPTLMELVEYSFGDCLSQTSVFACDA